MNDITAMQTAIDELTAKLKAQLTEGKPIDPNRIQQLIEMRRDRDYSLAMVEQQRTDKMMCETNSMTSKFPALTKTQTKLHAALLDRIQEQRDLYDRLATRWVNDEVCPWEDSQAASVAAGILILFNEIR